MDRRSRAGFYSAFSSAFDEPEPCLLLHTRENPLLVALGDAVSGDLSDVFAEPYNRLWDSIDELCDFDRMRSLEKLEVEHARLFLGPHSVPVSPYEHAYRGRKSPADSSVELLGVYRSAGLGVNPKFRDLPDHVCLEMEFMAHLLHGGRAAEAEQFRRTHLDEFLPKFASDVRRHTTSSFYDSAAHALATFAGIESATRAGEDDAGRHLEETSQ
ncbi:MAG: molecular chaperone [Planctomycetota bacterium]